MHDHIHAHENALFHCSVMHALNIICMTDDKNPSLQLMPPKNAHLCQHHVSPPLPLPLTFTCVYWEPHASSSYYYYFFPFPPKDTYRRWEYVSHSLLHSPGHGACSQGCVEKLMALQDLLHWTKYLPHSLHVQNEGGAISSGRKEGLFVGLGGTRSLGGQ